MYIKVYIYIGSSWIIIGSYTSINRPNQVQSIQTKASPSNQRFHIASRLQHPFLVGPCGKKPNSHKVTMPSTRNRNNRTSAGC